MHRRTLNPAQQAQPADPVYLLKKLVWRGWIRSLSWLRRHHLSPR